MDIRDVFSELQVANFVPPNVRPIFEALTDAYKAKQDDENISLCSMEFSTSIYNYSAKLAPASSDSLILLEGVPEVQERWDRLWQELQLDEGDRNKNSVLIGLLVFLSTRPPIYNRPIDTPVSKSTVYKAAKDIPSCLQARYERQAAWLIIRASKQSHLITDVNMRRRVEKVLSKLGPNEDQGGGHFRVKISISSGGGRPLFTILRLLDIGVLRNYKAGGVESFRRLQKALANDEDLQCAVRDVLRCVDRECDQSLAKCLVQFLAKICRRSLFKFAIQKTHGIENGQSSISFRSQLATTTAANRKKKEVR